MLNPICRVGNSEVSLSHNQMRFERARTTKARGDDYLLKLFPEAPMVDISNPLLQFALSPENTEFRKLLSGFMV
jgi:hypothetical protein